PETAIWAGRRGYTYVPFLVPFDIARELFDYYRQGAAEVGRTVTPDNLGFLICAVTADTTAKAVEAGKHFVWRMGPTLRAPVEWFRAASPRRTPAAARCTRRRGRRPPPRLDGPGGRRRAGDGATRPRRPSDPEPRTRRAPRARGRPRRSTSRTAPASRTARRRGADSCRSSARPGAAPAPRRARWGRRARSAR